MKRPTPVILVLLLFSLKIFSQPPYDNIPVIPYHFDKFEQKRSFPYGQKFYITGPLIQLDQPPADVVILNIYELDRKGNRLPSCMHYSGYYWKMAEELSNEFKLFIDRPLLFSREYEFEFQFFSSAQFTAGTEIVHLLIKKLDAEFTQTGDISSYDLSQALDSLNLELSQAHSFGRLDYVMIENCDPNDQSVSFQERIFQFVEGVETIEFPIQTDKGMVSKEDLENLVVNEYLVRSGTKQVQQYRNALSDNITENIDALYEVVRKLETVYATDPTSMNLVLTDIQKLRDLIDNRKITAAQEPFFPTGAAPYNLLDADHKQLLANLLIARKNLSDEERRLQRHEEKVTEIRDRIGTFEEIIIAGYAISGTSISYQKVSYNEEIEVDAAQTTTPVGISGAFLNPVAQRGPSDLDAFANAAMRTYFLPVDKRLSNKKAYSGGRPPFNRMSATFGVSLSPISYRGQELESVVSVKPLLAIGYDITRAISIDFGGIFFRQKHPNPLIEEDQIKFAPTFSVQFDGNLFNRMRHLDSGGFQLGY